MPSAFATERARSPSGCAPEPVAPTPAIEQAPRRLFVVDLTRGGGTRRLLLRAAELRVRVAASGIARGAPRPLVLVYAPEGGGAGVRWPEGVETVDAASLLSEDARAQAFEWVHRASHDVVRGRGSSLFPVVDGVPLAELSTLALQMPMASYALLVAGMLGACERHRVVRCTILTGYLPTLRALRAELGGRVPRVDGWAPPDVGAMRRLAMRAISRARGQRQTAMATESEPIAGLAAAPRGGALLIAESAPIVGMFAALEPRLLEGGVRPVIHLRYAVSPREPEIGPVRTVLHAMQPAIAASRRVGRFRGLARAACREASRILRSHPGGPGATPIGLFLEPLFDGVFDAQADHLSRADAILDALQPKVVVVGNDRWWVGQAFVQLARRRGIPTVAVQDGVEGIHPTWFWTSADRYCASGTHLKEQLLAHGVPHGRVTVTGQPRYDALFATPEPDARVRVRESLGLSADGLYVLFAAQPMQDAAFAPQVVEAVLSVPGARVLLRPHPSSPLAPYQALAERHGDGRVCLQRAASINDLLRAADVLVTQHSTVVIEAAILGTRVITANFTGLDDPTPYAKLGIARAVRTPAALADRVRELAATRPSPGAAISAGTRLPAGVVELIGEPDGRAGARVAAVITEAIERG
jgi:hypothetical protein